jgi:hypothetical protein
MLDDDPELLEDDEEKQEWAEGQGGTADAEWEDWGEGELPPSAAEEWLEGVTNSCDSGHVAGGGGRSGGGGGGGGVGSFNVSRRHSHNSQTSVAAAAGDGATTSALVVSKRRSLLWMFDDVNHYYPDGTAMDPAHVEVRRRALRSLLAEHAKYGWILILAVMPIHWYRTGPGLAIPVHRVVETLAANLLVVVLMCMDVVMKLGIIARHSAVTFVLMGLVFLSCGYMMVFVPKEQALEANSFSAIKIIACLTVCSVINFPNRRLALLCATTAALYELPSVLYFAAGGARGTCPPASSSACQTTFG